MPQALNDELVLDTKPVLDDEVVLIDEDGTPIGRASRTAVHGPDTALHLAFSCHVVNPAGEVLITRRALTKQAWPGVWTNSFCGHPRPAESLVNAVHRRADFELRLPIAELELALPHFRYRATDSNGIVENELCPVYTATTDREPDPDPREVDEYAWVQPGALMRAVQATPFVFSPWLVLQTRALELYP